MEFIKPPIEKAKVRTFDFTNFPVNISLVTGLQKTTHYVASDGFWSVLEPIIKFHGTDIKWHFGERGERERDLCYDNLMSQFSINIQDIQNENKILKEQLTKVKELLLRSSATTIMTELRETIESFK